MTDQPITRPSLLLRIRDPRDTGAWSQFAEIYTPLVYRYAMRRGLQDADASDVAQDVLKAVASAAPKFEYDRARGTFRSWFYTVARSKLNDHLAKRLKQPVASGETRVQQMLENQPNAAADDEQARWDLDYQRQVFDWASRQVQPHVQETTWRAFWQTAVQHRPSKDVAESLGLSVGAVYVAKSRVIAQIRQRVQQITGDLEGFTGDGPPPQDAAFGFPTT